MSGMIRLDLAAISGAAGRARQVQRVFDDSEDSAGQAADACGHAGLADAVERFASTWEERREGFAENLGKLGGALEDIDRAFRELDRSLVSEGGA